jgi:hypothetical protein
MEDVKMEKENKAATTFNETVQQTGENVTRERPESDQEIAARVRHDRMISLRHGG